MKNIALISVILVVQITNTLSILAQGVEKYPGKETFHIGDKKLYYGAAYYPEAWDISEIDMDIVRMKELKMNVMRMAEFSWVLMEPSEGRFEFDWLHSIIEKLHENGISVILGTPTATPPAWMAEKYPEIFITNSDGSVRGHGARRNCSYTSEKYREKSRIICEKMAREFGHKPGVIAWQTDNEFHLSPDYSKETEKIWHHWLKDRYKHIDSLNHIWKLQLWSQQYDDFSQVPMPGDDIWHHPSLRLNWLRFTNDQIAEYQDIQLKAIRKYSNLPITHDGMPGQQIDYEKLFEDLDFMAVNNYHSFEAYDRIQSNYDRMRGYHKGFHWLFENAPNNSGGGKEGKTWFIHQPDGSMRAAIWMNYALGGQGAMFWLWRQHPAGQEMPHGSIISAWGKPTANYQDLKQLGKELNQCSPFLMENPVMPAKAAIFWSHENISGLNIEQYANDIKYYNDWTYRFYRPLADIHLHMDVINPGADISSYKLLFMPMMPYIPVNLRNMLKEWVAAGGVLVIGPMSGYRTEEWTSFTDHAMGDLNEWTDIEVESRIPIGTSRRPAEIPVMLKFNEYVPVKKQEASLWSEALSTQKGKILAYYQNGMHNNKPAIIESKVGKGRVIMLGCDPGYDYYKHLGIKYSLEKGIRLYGQGDKNIVVAPRGRNLEGFVIINLNNEKKKLNLDLMQYEDILTGWHPDSEFLLLKPYEVRVMRKSFP